MLLKDVFPKGVFNVVAGDDKLDFNVGAHLSRHAKVNMVSFTGSVPTGKKIAAECTKDMRRFCLEAGGNDAAIVLPDSDPKAVAPGLFSGAFNNSGQICCAVKRCYVHESIHDGVVEELVRCAKKAKFGDGFSEDVEYGPLNNKMQFDKVMSIIEDTRQVAGAKIECGGKKMEEGKGYFIEPTIVTGVKEGSRIVDEEQFGPVLPVIKYFHEADALKRANASHYGLGGSVWSADENKAATLASQLEAGTVWINCHTDLTGGPFGGFKESGMGREFSVADINNYTEMQSVFVKAK
jgi:acyl-CoA reductase-like NAD-dependent aldehyde dehydrogenase